MFRTSLDIQKTEWTPPLLWVIYRIRFSIKLGYHSENCFSERCLNSRWCDSATSNIVYRTYRTEKRFSPLKPSFYAESDSVTKVNLEEPLPGNFPGCRRFDSFGGRGWGGFRLCRGYFCWRLLHGNVRFWWHSEFVNIWRVEHWDLSFRWLKLGEFPFRGH